MVFHGPDGRKLNGDTLLKRFKRCLAKEGILDVTIHDLRRTFSSWAMQNDVSPKKLAEWLGHVDTRMVERHYGHLSVESLKAVSDAAGVGHNLAIVEREEVKLANASS